MSKIAAFAAAALSILTVSGDPVVGHESRGAVYTMSNAAAANEVLMYDRAPDGGVNVAGAAATGGTGSGGGLDNQGAGTRRDRQRSPFAVNAVRNDVSRLLVRV